MKNLYTKLAIVAGAAALVAGAITASAGGEMVTICHATGSGTEPFQIVTINVNGLHGHEDHTGDIIPMPEAGCEEPEK